jgi:HlyD family secretion protein
MDSPVPKKYKRKLLAKNIGLVSLIIIVPMCIVLFIKITIAPSISQTNLPIGIVDMGSLEITASGSGVIMPNYEEVLTAPFQSKILKVNKTPGTFVNMGDTLLTLDSKSAEEHYNSLKNELELKTIQHKKLSIQIRESEEDFAISKQIREIRIENLKAAYEAEAYLSKLGGSTKELVKKASTQWEIAELELTQAVGNYKNHMETSQVSLKELETIIRIQKEAVDESYGTIRKALLIAPFSGILSFLMTQNGARISEGQELARIADISKYRIKGSISNVWMGRVHPGQRVLIRNRGQVSFGAVDNVMTSLDNGLIECDIRIDDSDLSNFRPNLQVDIRIVVSEKEQSMRLPNGVFYKTPGKKVLYVIKGNKAIRTNVNLGEANFDYVEVVSGLDTGDQVVLRDIAEKYDRQELKVK